MKSPTGTRYEQDNFNSVQGNYESREHHAHAQKCSEGVVRLNFIDKMHSLM